MWQGWLVAGAENENTPGACAWRTTQAGATLDQVLPMKPIHAPSAHNQTCRFLGQPRTLNSPVLTPARSPTAQSSARPPPPYQHVLLQCRHVPQCQWQHGGGLHPEAVIRHSQQRQVHGVAHRNNWRGWGQQETMNNGVRLGKGTSVSGAAVATLHFLQMVGPVTQGLPLL